MGGRPLVLGLSPSCFLNLDVSLTEASARNLKNSDLSITTTPVPLSGFVTIVSSRCFRRLIAFCRVLGGLGPLLLVCDRYV